MIRCKHSVYLKIFGVCFAVIITGFAAANLIIPDKEYSGEEKRVLAARPSFSINAVLDGSFMEQFDDYETDQFVGRSAWMRIKTGFFKLTGSNMSQDVYFCKNSYLCEKFPEPDEDLLEETGSKVLEFAESYPEVNTYFLLVPTAISVNEELLPSFAITANQDEYIDNLYNIIKGDVTAIDVRELFSQNKGTSLYYRTDHHWTTDAAYEAYMYAADIMKLKKDSFRNGYAAENFYGSLTAKSGYSVSKPDKIKVYLPDTPVDAVVTYVEEKKKSTSCYQVEYLSSDDPYQVFFGGNHSQINIETDSESDRRLLIMKDSYANCFVPFLLSSFRQITIIDPRYYYGSLDSLMLQNEYTDVLYLYNATTLSQDNNLCSVLENRR